MRPRRLPAGAGRADYRRELRQHSRGLRFAGLAVVIVGALLVASGYLDPREPSFQTLGWALVIGGWILLIVNVVLRSRYHAERIRDLDP